MKLLYIVPLHLGVEVLKSVEKELMLILENHEFHYERVICLYDFLLRAYLKNFQGSVKEDHREYLEVSCSE